MCIISIDDCKKPGRKIEQCPYCDAKKTTNNIKAHIAIHLKNLEGGKKHKCLKCDYTTNWAPHLKIHVNIKHNVEHQLAKLQRKQSRKTDRNGVVEPNVCTSIGSEVIDVGDVNENVGMKIQEVEHIDQAIQTDVGAVVAINENVVIQIDEVEHMDQSIQTDFNDEGDEVKPSLTSVNMKLGTIKQVLQIHQEAAQNATQEALTVHIKLMENLAPLFSDAASIIEKLNKRVEVELASENLYAIIFGWIQFTKDLCKWCHNSPIN